MKKVTVLALSLTLLSASSVWAQNVCENLNGKIQALLQEENIFEQSAGKGFTIDQTNAQRNALDQKRAQLMKCLSPESRKELMDSITRIKVASKGAIARQSTSEQVHRRALSLTKENRPISPNNKTPEALVDRKIYQR